MTDEAFSRAARTYGDTLFRVAYHALQNRADAEDVMQDTFVKAFHAAGMNTGESSKARTT